MKTEYKPAGFRVRTDLDKELNILSATIERTKQDLMEEAIIDLLKKYKGGSKMDRELAIGTMWSRETTEQYQWDNTYPILDESGKITGIHYADDYSTNACIGDEFMCAPEIAEQLATKFGLSSRYIDWPNEKDPS